MHTNYSRRLGSAVTALLLAGTGAAATASAAPSEHLVTTISDVSCVFETVDSDLVFFGATASSSTGGSGSFMFVESFEDGVVMAGEGGTAVFGDDGSFTAELQMFSAATGEPVGTATVTGTRTAVGDPVTRDARDRSGNAWVEKGTVTTTDYAFEVADVTVPGHDVQPGEDDCTSQDLAFDVRSTHPAASVFRDTGFDSDICRLAGLEPAEVRISGSVREPVFEVVIDDGAAPQKAEGSIALRGGKGRATADLVDLATGEVVADLAIRVDLARVGTRQIESEAFDGVSVRMARTAYTATIEVTTSDGRSGVAECPSLEYSETIILRPGSGPRGR